jgi:hypothetical protein
VRTLVFLVLCLSACADTTQAEMQTQDAGGCLDVGPPDGQVFVGISGPDAGLTAVPLQNAVSSGAVEFSGDHWEAKQVSAVVFVEIAGPEGAQFDYISVRIKQATTAPCHIQLEHQEWAAVPHCGSGRMYLKLDEPLRFPALKPSGKHFLSWSSGADGDELLAVDVLIQ